MAAPTNLRALAPPSHFLTDSLIASTSACVLHPRTFFVSWQGVLTLAYSGFPPALCDLKSKISEHFTGLPSESPGSKWPKTSLGALKEGKRLNPAQLDLLKRVCRDASAPFAPERREEGNVLLVDRLSVVVYECRCLERQVSKHTVALAEPADTSGPDRDEVARVESVVGEADDPEYWFHASRDGSRENHYRGNAMGVTLVHELDCFQPQTASLRRGVDLPGAIRSFRAEVERALPGYYAWFEESSLHVTVRAIIA